MNYGKWIESLENLSARLKDLLKTHQDEFFPIIPDANSHIVMWLNESYNRICEIREHAEKVIPYLRNEAKKAVDTAEIEVR